MGEAIVYHFVSTQESESSQGSLIESSSTSEDPIGMPGTLSISNSYSIFL